MPEPSHADLEAQLATLTERIEGMRAAADRDRRQAAVERGQLREDVNEIKEQLAVGKGRMWAILILFTAGISAVGAGLGRWFSGN